MNEYIVYVLLPQIFDGLVIGAAIVLVALGLTMIFGLMGVINLAHGELYMFGAYVAVILSDAGALGFWLSLVLAPFVVGSMGLIMEGAVVRPLFRRKDVHTQSILATFGVSLMLQDCAYVLFGRDTHQVAMPVTGMVAIGPLLFPAYRLTMLAISAALIAALWFVLFKTPYGALFRAVMQDRQMAASLGIRVRRIQLVVFFLGCALAGAAGVLLSPIYSVFPTTGHDFVLLAFAVIIVGGIGSIGGAVVAGLLLLQVQSLGALVLPPVWAEVSVFAAMLLILVFKPNGFFGRLEA